MKITLNKFTNYVNQHFSRDPAERSALRLTGTMILITNIEQYKLHCPNGTTEFNASSNYCVISAPCECALQTDEILLPALLSDCEPGTEIESKFLVNLKLLYAFFNESNLLSFDGGSLLNHPINISLPVFNFHQSYDTYLHEQIVKINMERLSEEIKKDKQLYYSHESEMRYRLSEIQGPILFDFSNSKDVTLLVSGILIILISIITMNLLCRISRLAVILNTIRVAEAIVNASHPYFLIYGEQNVIHEIIENPSQNGTAPFSFQIDLQYHTTTAQFFLTTVTIFILIAILIKLRPKEPGICKSFGCQIFFNIASESESALIPSQNFGDVARNYEFTCGTYIKDTIALLGFKPILKIRWDVEFRHVPSSWTFQFKKEIPISFGQARAIRRIVATEKYFVVVLLRIEDGNFETIDVNQQSDLKQSKEPIKANAPQSEYVTESEITKAKVGTDKHLYPPLE